METMSNSWEFPSFGPIRYIDITSSVTHLLFVCVPRYTKLTESLAALIVQLCLCQFVDYSQFPASAAFDAYNISQSQSQYSAHISESATHSCLHRRSDCISSTCCLLSSQTSIPTSGDTNSIPDNGDIRPGWQWADDRRWNGWRWRRRTLAYSRWTLRQCRRRWWTARTPKSRDSATNGRWWVHVVVMNICETATTAKCSRFRLFASRLQHNVTQSVQSSSSASRRLRITVVPWLFRTQIKHNDSISNNIIP